MQPAHQASNEVRLPRAVARQVQDLDARFKREPGTTDLAADPPPPATPSATVATPVDSQPPKDPAADPRRADPAYWEQRLRAVDGVLKKERAEHAGEVERAYQRIAELESEVATLKAQPSPSSSEIDLGKYFTPEQIERIGEDECKSIAAAAEKAAQEVSRQAMDKVEAMLKPAQERQQREADRAGAQRKSDFITAVAAEVPNFEEIDTDQRWLDWLAQPVSADAPDGEIRQDLLSKRSRAFNAPAVIKMFKDYLKTIATPAPPIAPSSDTPSLGGTPPPPTVQAGKRPTGAEIKAFYTRAALGKVKDQERTDFEARMKLPA